MRCSADVYPSRPHTTCEFCGVTPACTCFTIASVVAATVGVAGFPHLVPDSSTSATSIPSLPATTSRPTCDQARPNDFWRRVWRATCTAAGLTGVDTYTLKHTAVSMAIASGAVVYVIQRMCGHA